MSLKDYRLNIAEHVVIVGDELRSLPPSRLKVLPELCRCHGRIVPRGCLELSIRYPRIGRPISVICSA